MKRDATWFALVALIWAWGFLVGISIHSRDTDKLHAAAEKLARLAEIYK